MEQPRLLLDSPSLYFRAFFALPQTHRSPAGRPVNAVRGYLDMVARLLIDHRPREIVHVFDADWRPAWRVAAWPGYKSHRIELAEPPDLAGQPEAICELLTAAGQPIAFAAGYEADDVIATLAEQATPGRPDRIISGDRDLLQLVRDDGVQLLFTMRGVSELARFDEAAVERKYGIPPARYADFAILRGDPSDGLPGLRGVGEKTAAELIRRHGSLAALLEDPPPRQARAIADQAGYLRAMQVVVPVVRDVDVEVSLGGPPDPDAVMQVAERHGVREPARRLLDALAPVTRGSSRGGSTGGGASSPL